APPPPPPLPLLPRGETGGPRVCVDSDTAESLADVDDVDNDDSRVASGRERVLERCSSSSSSASACSSRRMLNRSGVDDRSEPSRGAPLVFLSRPSALVLLWS